MFPHQVAEGVRIEEKEHQLSFIIEHVSVMDGQLTCFDRLFQLLYILQGEMRWFVHDLSDSSRRPRLERRILRFNDDVNKTSFSVGEVFFQLDDLSSHN